MTKISNQEVIIKGNAIYALRLLAGQDNIVFLIQIYI